MRGKCCSARTVVEHLSALRFLVPRDAAQLRRVRCRAGDVKARGRRRGSGSAKQRFTAHRAREKSDQTADRAPVSNGDFLMGATLRVAPVVCEQGRGLIPVVVTGASASGSAVGAGARDAVMTVGQNQESGRRARSDKGFTKVGPTEATARTTRALAR